MNCLEANCEEITFKYDSKGHLTATLSFHNPSHSRAHFKFKVTRPKYYLIRPDQGLAEALSDIKVTITLHQDGVKEAENDRVKLYYQFLEDTPQSPPKGWQKEDSAMNLRFTVLVDGLPQEYRQSNDKIKTSEVKSMANSKFGSARLSSESNMEERQRRFGSLRTQMEELRHKGGKMLQSSSQNKEYLMAGAVGLVLGLLSSLWI